ncbi:MAG: DUF4097 family beta strand repeat-containing protein [Eubacteriales bacterium]|nr:DUF4097 family beta strand repeat-containing protein [Eubacteriales bacterium]
MAKSKVKRGFLYYLLIFCALLLGLFCIFAAILIFNPGKDVYGINLRYVSHHKEIIKYKSTDTNTNLDDLSFSSVEFNSGSTDFEIDYDLDAVFTSVHFKPYVTALSKNEDTNFTLKIELVGSKLVISVEEPELWLTFSNRTSVSFVCPKNKTFANYDFNINTKSGNVGIGDKTQKPYEIKSLNITTESGEVLIHNNMKVSSQDINIKTNTGRITVNSNITGTLSIENDKGKLDIGNLKGSLKIINHDRLEADCTSVAKNVSIRSINGYIRVGSLGENFSNGHFTTTDSAENTNIVIEKMTGNATITNTTGYVAINDLGGQALIETTTGNVEINKAYNNCDVKTLNGSVNITQLGETARTTVKTEKGNITLNFAEIGTANLTTKQASIFINVTTGKPFILDYTTKNGIEASWATTDLGDSGILYVSGAESSSTKRIVAIAENGKINVKEGFIVK